MIGEVLPGSVPGLLLAHPAHQAESAVVTATRPLSVFYTRHKKIDFLLTFLKLTLILYMFCLAGLAQGM